ncbi:MAG: N-acetyltransferase [Candidatus Desulfofervidus auxilii]|nr:N-acetyltransferase [Candidatus Desulfofervidus auxilii]
MNQVEIIPVEDKKQLDTFVKIPWKIYKNNPYWVPPLISERKTFLNPKKNPFFSHATVKLFLAYKGKEPVGRIAAVIDRQYINYYQENVGYFGLFETLKDYSIAISLFNEAEKFLKDQGMKKILGPLNLSTNHECGLLIEGFDYPPTVMMPYNPPYYKEYIEKSGFKKAQDLCSYYVDFNQVDERVFKRVEQKAARKNLTVRKIKINDPEEIKKIRGIYNDAWGRNWGFVPLTDEEFFYLAKELKKLVIPDLALVIEKDGKIVGFNLSIWDINPILKKLNGRLFPFGIFKWLYYSRKLTFVRGITLGISEQYRYILGPLLFLKLLEISKQKGFLRWEIGWVLENNVIVQNIFKKINAKLYKKYRIFVKEL